jgi:hypothetical protein
MSYDIVRFYFSGGSRIVARQVTLEEAQAHCRNPETSSRTATSAASRLRTERLGPWFDGWADSVRDRKKIANARGFAAIPPGVSG